MAVYDPPGIEIQSRWKPAAFVVEAALEANSRDLQTGSASWRKRLISGQLSNEDRALAYSRLFTLLSGLYLRGLTPGILEPVQKLPSLSPFIPEPLDLDLAAAEHQHLFGFNVFPYESAFLDPSGLLGGAVSDELVHLYRQDEFDPALSSEGPDHIGIELAYLAHLCRREADSWTGSQHQQTSYLRERQRDFIDGWLFKWLAPFILAVRQQGDRFFSQLLELTFDALNEQRAGLGLVERDAARLPPWQPDQVGVYGDVKAATAHLLIPIHSGLYLSRDDIGRLARNLSLPRGFGGRRQMMENLFQSSLTYDQLPNLVASLQELADGWEAGYRELESRSGNTLQVRNWNSRLETTRYLVSRLAG